MLKALLVIATGGLLFLAWRLGDLFGSIADHRYAQAQTIMHHAGLLCDTDPLE